MIRIDIHTHAFRDEDTPTNIFGIASRVVGKKHWRLKLAAFLLHVGLPTNKDVLERLSRFLKQSTKTTEEQLKDILSRVDAAVILTMDMAQMGAGKVKRHFEEQLDELIALKAQGYNIYIYMHLDPKRLNLVNLVEHYHDKIDGYKLYPPISGYPTHPTIVSIINKYPKPVISHCTDTSPIYYKGDDLEEMIDWTHWTARRGSRQEMCQSFSHPYWLAELSKLIPPWVPVSAAHAGGSNPRLRQFVYKYCRLYPNMFADDCFTNQDPNIRKEVRENMPSGKRLGGTDDYMTDPNFIDTEAYQNNLKFVSCIHLKMGTI